MALNLHRVHNHSDWDEIKPAAWNKWQKIAAPTHGIVTPGNLISCGGAILVFIGLFQLMNEVTITGVLLVAVGRLADAVDGFVADKTGTKSRVGEAIDSTMDKLVAGAALITVFAYDLLPVIVTIIIAAHTLINSIIAIVGRLRNVDMHPSLFGKLATLLIWVTILSYLMAYFLENKTELTTIPSITYGLSWLLFTIFFWLAAVSTADYYKQIQQ